ncbi:hypothetical protein GCM10011514_51290 [Emticicia aquatilis]|uniref:SnoaL-like domain-containing protein n=1 Tax=Emticicia aquatilis TaxID=1537369 RepID=A0A917DZ04_9BACT|nr:nuclear transport factor 2 family protein [Emticicia aquatilis]GGD80902.1 hypothetical protein GCM10011514_51290 [Emticicia aquatilis]
MKKLLLYMTVQLFFLNSSTAQNEPNEVLVTTFLAAVKNHDAETFRKVLDENIEWIQPGNNLTSGTKKGLVEVLAMSKAINVATSKTFQLVDFKIIATGTNEVLCQLHFKAARQAGAVLDVINYDVYSIENGKIITAKIYSADIKQEDYFYGK